MLLHGDGTNGAQNNTFIDSSTNNFTITRNGNTTQGSFSPYGSNWSNYFLGTGNYLSLPSNAAFNLGTGAYTVEAWVYLESYAGSNEIVMFCNGNATGAIACSINTSGQIYLSKYGTGQVITGSSGDVPLNQWNHIAYVRTSTSSNDTKLYVNGVVKATGTDSNNWNVTTTPTVGGLTIGGFGIIGYISNVRVVKGTAVYTGAFTPSTTPLTAISGTSLLTCQSNRFIDNSSNAFAITATGTPSVQRFNPFGTATAYSTSVIGGSGYFDGSGDYLSAPTNSAFAYGTGNFTIELWAYPTSFSGYKTFYSGYLLASSAAGFELGIDGSGFLYIYSNGVFAISASSSALLLNAWNHVAMVRNGSTITVYINGVSKGTWSLSSQNFTDNYCVIGKTNTGSSQYFTGYMNDFRIVKGTAVYTTTFTPPTAPLAVITNTSLLTNFTNGAIFDNAMMNDLETVGNAQISTSVKKYGTGSIAFDGTDDRLPTASSPNIPFGTGDFTVEAWIYPNVLTGEPGFLQTSDADGALKTTYATGIIFILGPSPFQLRANVGGTDINSGSTYISASTWTHVALTRASGSVRMFINGTLVSGPTTITANLTGQNIVVGGYYNTSFLWNGYIDDLRITKGYARYTANFSAPTSALSDTGPI